MAEPLERMLSLYLLVNSCGPQHLESPHPLPASQLLSRPFCDQANEGLMPGVVGSSGILLLSNHFCSDCVMPVMYQSLRIWYIIPEKKAGQPCGCRQRASPSPDQWSLFVSDPPWCQVYSTLKDSMPSPHGLSCPISEGQCEQLSSTSKSPYGKASAEQSQAVHIAGISTCLSP